MKGLIITTLIIITLIAISSGASLIIASDLSNKLAVANESGFAKGYAQGYEVGFLEGSEVGYQEGSKIGYERGSKEDLNSSSGRGFYFAYNPTYDEVHEILAENKQASAKEIHNYAETNGIRAAYVRAPIAREAIEGTVYLYQLVAFETVDRGLVIIEPWSHREVKVEVGKRYSKLNGFPPRDYDDTITEITIVW
ncbi:hypothetical protein ACFLUU_07065 [Chloroflexota bacterium]